MSFQQLKILLWRNAVLKKRSIFSTLLEIVIPTIIIFILVSTKKNEFYSFKCESTENIPPYIVNNFTRITNIPYRNEYYIVFSKDFDSKTQNTFLENFKNDRFFSTFKYLDENTNFSKCEQNCSIELYYGEMPEENTSINNSTENNNNDHNEIDNYNNTINGNNNNNNIDKISNGIINQNIENVNNINGMSIRGFINNGIEVDHFQKKYLTDDIEKRIMDYKPNNIKNDDKEINKSQNKNNKRERITNDIDHLQSNSNESIDNAQISNDTFNNNTQISTDTFNNTTQISTDTFNNTTQISTDTFNNNSTQNNFKINDLPSIVQEYKIFLVKNEDDLFEIIKRKNFNEKFFNENSFHNYYGISFQSIHEYTLFFDKYSDLYEILTDQSKYNSYGYTYSTYLRIYNLQLITNNAILKTLTNSFHQYTNSSQKIPEIEFHYKNMDKAGFSEIREEKTLQEILPLLMIFYFIPCICNLLSHLVLEKESKIKESLVIIGLKKSSFWLSWALTYGIIVFIASAFATFFIRYYRIFIYIHWTIILTIVFIFGLASCGIAFALSTLINKSKTSNTIGAVVILLYFALFFVNALLLEEGSLSKYIYSILLPPIAFLSLINPLITIESQNLAMSFSNMFSHTILRNYFMTLIGSFVFYFILALYLDNILPQGTNLHKKWYFIFVDFFHGCISKNSSSSHNTNINNNGDMNNNDENKGNNSKIYNNSYNNNNFDNPFIEKDPEGFEMSVQVDHINRNFKLKGKTIQILKDISFNAYYNEIFAILGHNGAGKTTLLRIMTGMLSSTNGEVYYDHIPIKGHETEICPKFGYCPQFDTFNNSLTVGEHVKLFAGIKNLMVEVDEVLKEIDLLNKKDNYPKELSGGQRRKLCISLALLGSPKYVFLDEPTTGLDPYSRKNIWKYLSKKKEQGCTIFITTHYMDEADILADRKMIISNGQITCLGTSLFLKNAFSMNYTLDVTMTHQKDCLLVDPIIDYYCPGFSQTKVFTTASYSYSINREQDISNNNNNSNNNNKIENNYQNSIIKAGNHLNNNNDINNTPTYIVTYLLSMKRSEYFNEILYHINLLIKDTNNSINNFSLTAPTLEELFIKLESNKGKKNEGFTEKIQKNKNVVTIDMNNNNNNNINNNNNNNNDSLIHQLDPIFMKNKNTNLHSSFLRQITALLKTRLKIFVRNKTFAIIYTLFPICLIIVSIYFENRYVDTLYNRVTSFRPLDIKSNLYEEGKWFKNLNASNGTALDIINEINVGKFSIPPLESIDYDQSLTLASHQLTKEKESLYIGGFAGVVAKDEHIEFTIYNNLKYNFGIPIAINILHNTLLEHYQISKKSIKVTYHPFPLFIDYKSNENDKNNLINIVPEIQKLKMEMKLLIGMAIAISLSISIYAPLTVKEKEDGITWQLYLNGMKRINYWIAIFLSDMICLLIPILFVFIIGYLYELTLFHKNVILITLLLTIFWIIGSLAHQYVISHFFRRYDRCFNLLILINPIMTLFFGIYSIVNTSDAFSDGPENQMKDDNENDLISTLLNKLIYFVIAIYFPSVIVYYYTELNIFLGRKQLNIDANAITKFTKSKIYQEINSNPHLKVLDKSKLLTKSFFNLHFPSFMEIIQSAEVKRYILLGIILFLVYLILLILLEKSKIKQLKSHREYTSEEQNIKNKKLKEGPQDVYQEFKRIEKEIHNENTDDNNKDKNNSLKVYRLNKEFKISKSKMNRKKRQMKKEAKKEEKRNKRLEDKKKKKNKKKSRKSANNNQNITSDDQDFKILIPREEEEITINEYSYNHDYEYDLSSVNQKNDNAFDIMDNRLVYNKDIKKYINRIVDDVTFGIEVGECLGLLGPNGAGKTTSIGMITGTVSRTHGNVVYGHRNINDNDLSQVSLGYCSQMDALWKYLTVQEIVQFYLNICGYPPRDIPHYSKTLIELCGIENHTHKKVSEISGGTKRKLSLIIAICSSPNYLILDEPSAGMDPFTRRYMWRLIDQFKKIGETATLLTTHSTEEAEALCDRIAILIKGQLVCIDTPRSIKMNQNNRYLLEVFTDNPQKFEELFVKKDNLFGLEEEGHYDLESSFNYQKYSVEMDIEKIPEVFAKMEKAKKSGLVTQYNFGQYSLEQIFIDFVNKSKYDKMK